MIGTALGAALGSHAALKITVGTLTAALTVGGTAAITGDQPDAEHCIVVDAAGDAWLTTPQQAITGYGDFGLGVDDLVELDGDGVVDLYIDGVDASLANAANLEVCIGDDGKAATSEAVPATEAGSDEAGDDGEATTGEPAGDDEAGDDGEATTGEPAGDDEAGDDGEATTGEPVDDGDATGETPADDGQASTGEADTPEGTTLSGDGKEMTKDGDGTKSMIGLIVDADADDDAAVADADAKVAIEADTATHSDTDNGSGLFIGVGIGAHTADNLSARVAAQVAAALDRCLG